jgi:hypothetical protein
MDPNLFHVDINRTTEVLLLLVLLSFMLERALSPIVEHRWFVERFDKKGIKEFLALALSAAVCILWQFDAVSAVILSEKTSLLGELITASVIAGGSKGSLKFFRDWLDVSSSAYKAKNPKPAPAPNP